MMIRLLISVTLHLQVWVSTVCEGDAVVQEPLIDASGHAGRRLQLYYPEDDEGTCYVCLKDRHVQHCQSWPVGEHKISCWDSVGTMSVECGYIKGRDKQMAYRKDGKCNGPKHPIDETYCSMGETCQLWVKGQGFQRYPYSYFTLSAKYCNDPQPVAMVPPLAFRRGTYQHVNSDRLQVQISPVPGYAGINYLCWSHAHNQPALIAAVKVFVGPIPDKTNCVLGVPCYPRFQQYNSAMSGLDKTLVSVIPQDLPCETTKHAELGPIEVWNSSWKDLQKDGRGETFHYAKVFFGTPSLGEKIGRNYHMCWHNNPGATYAGGSLTSFFENPSASFERQKLLLDKFGLIGPSPQDARAECILGFPCEIAIDGYLIASEREFLRICGGYVPEMLYWNVTENQDGLGTGNFTASFMLPIPSESRVQEPLCWQAWGGQEFRVGTVTLMNECPKRSKSWPEKGSTITLPAGKSQSELFFAQVCDRGSVCTNCQKATETGYRFRASAYFILTDEENIVKSCSSELVCNAEDCFVNMDGPEQVGTGDELVGTAYVNTRYQCANKANIMVVAFGCQKYAVITFMSGVALVLLTTVMVGLCLELIAKKSAKSCFEGTVELRCTGKEQPSFNTMRSCVTQAVSPDKMQWFDSWSSGATVFVRFRLPRKATPVRHWVTEVPGICRVDAASLQKVQTPGRLPGAGLLELAEACVGCCSGKGHQEDERLHFEYAVALLAKLRKPRYQAMLLIQYTLLLGMAVGLPLGAGQMMESCEDGYPVILHAMWGSFLFLQACFQRCMLKGGHPDPVINERFNNRFRLRLFSGLCVGIVSQTDMYMDLTFPIIAKSCNFELWMVAAWLCVLGIGLGQVGQTLSVIILGKWRARRATSPERRERAELSVLFFLLRVTDNVGLCFAVRPALDQRLGGSSSWAARVAEARVPTARFIFEDVEQSALQVIFLMFFDVATPSDVVWIALSITTSLLLSLLLMVQVLPEVRDWIWYRLLAVVRRRYRVPLLFVVFVLYRFVASAPWLFACSRFVADTTFLGLEVRERVLQEVFMGVFMTTVSLAMCCFIIWGMWKCQVKPPPKFQPPTYDAAVRFSPKAFGAWSTEQDEWLEPLRTCMAEEQDPGHRSAMQRLDNELFKLRHGLSNKVQATEALGARNVPEAVARCGQWVLGMAQLRELVELLLKDKRFTHAKLWKKSQMIDSMAAQALSNTKVGKVSSKDFFRLLPHCVLKNGIPRSSGGQTVSVSQAVEQVGKRRMVVIAVSHCWLTVDSSPPHPDNAALEKAKSLTNFAEWYIQHWGKDIEVFYWIDYSCIDQDNRDVSVALLPAFIACCTAMVLWRTQDYETRSWTAMERVLAYSYCEGGLTPYVIDAQFKNEGQAPRWEPRKLPDPLSNDSTTMVMNAADKHFIQQLLQCVFAVPAMEVFPDRQSISFGETEVVHLDLTTREPLRLVDTAADGFLDGVDKRIWLAAAHQPPAVNVGMRVRTKDQVALLMPADVANTFVPIFPVGSASAEQCQPCGVAEEDFPTVVAKFESLLSSNSRPSEMDVALLLEVLQNELEAAIVIKDEQRLIEVVELCQKFKAFPPAALEGRRQLCRPRLVAALKGSDRVLAHALQLAQQYGVDTEDFPEFRSAAAEQDRRRATSLQTELEAQMREAEKARDDVLMYAVWQSAHRASQVSGASDIFEKLAGDALESIAAMMAEKLRVPGIEDDANALQSRLELAASYGVEKSEACEEYREKLSVMRLDVARMTDAISLKEKGSAGVDELIEEILQYAVPIWILKPLLLKIVQWGMEQTAPDDLQESLRVAAVLGFPQEEEIFKAAVQKLKETLAEGLPEDWDVVRQEWSQQHMSVQQVKVEDKQMRESVQALFDYTMAGHKISTSDRFGSVPWRLKVKRVMRVRHPGNYLRYKTYRSKMMEEIDKKEDVQELGTVKTDIAAELPGLIDNRELSSSLNEVILFHGTSFKAADGIAAEGFRIDLAGSSTGSMFGRGAYFAERCLKSDEYSGCGHGANSNECCNTERPILICRVLLGKFKYDDSPHPESTELEKCCMEGDYDSILADREAANIKRGRNPTYREFVVFDKYQVLPEYVVWYTRSYYERIPKIIHPALSRSPPSVPTIEDSPASASTAAPTTAPSDELPSDPDQVAEEEICTTMI